MTDEKYNPHNPDSWTMGGPSVAGSAHQQICDWLRANGLNPARIPINPHASMVDGQLTLLQKVRSPHGGDLVSPDGMEIMTETVTVPVAVPPPPIVEIWLAPKCPTCGR